MPKSNLKKGADKRTGKPYPIATAKSDSKISDLVEVYLSAPSDELEQFGTFADSKQAPIHRWFQYPAGFSFRAVEHVLQIHHIRPGHLVYDPFVGTGTTVVVCKSKGIESYGIEAHPFVHKIATAKTDWSFDLAELINEANQITFELDLTRNRSGQIDTGLMPELVRKCFSEPNLRDLIYIRDYIDKNVKTKYRRLFQVALVCALRQASGAATGWPYIAPKKRIKEKDGLETFKRQLFQMVDDLKSIPAEVRKTPSHVILGDARDSHLPDDFFNLSFTSPPYLNNYDYADRTRLETYFNGYASSWNDITEKIRSQLIISATTQINRTNYDTENIISDLIKVADARIAAKLQESVNKLSTVRLNKGGKKSYDIMVGQYFNDMAMALADNCRVLKKGAHFVLILGDSAPYGVHIPTEEYLGRIGIGLGFRDFHVQKLRRRGDKWKGNSQRHHLTLKESVLTLEK
jgi:DNA modification methylase